jgi:hypothetical protein
MFDRTILEEVAIPFNLIKIRYLTYWYSVEWEPKNISINKLEQVERCDCNQIPILVHLLPSLGVLRLSSVVCKLFTFQASSPKPLGQLEPNIAGISFGWSSTKFLFFFSVGYSRWLPGPIICSDWLKFQRSSSLKLMNWLNPNCKWRIIVMSFTKFLFLCRSKI